MSHPHSAYPHWIIHGLVSFRSWNTTSYRRDFLPGMPVPPDRNSHEVVSQGGLGKVTHRIHGWYICLKTGYIDGKCDHINHMLP